MDEVVDLSPEEQVAQHYAAMIDSVQLIHAVIAGEQMQSATTFAKQGCVSRNVEHLEIMLAKDFWTTEDMSPFSAAIAAGMAYLSLIEA